MVTYSTTTAGLNPGSHQICVTAFGTDVTGGSANVSTCVTVKVYDLVLTGDGDQRARFRRHAHRHRDAERARRLRRRLPRRLHGQRPERRSHGGRAARRLQDGRVGARDVHVLGSRRALEPRARHDHGERHARQPDGCDDTETVTKRWVDTTPPVASACRRPTRPARTSRPRGPTRRAGRTRTASTC